MPDTFCFNGRVAFYEVVIIVANSCKNRATVWGLEFAAIAKVDLIKPTHAGEVACAWRFQGR